MGSYLQYPEYRDSGIPDIDLIPSHWISAPLFSIAKKKSIPNCSDRELLSVYLDRGVVRFSDVDEKRTNATSEDLSKYQQVSPGDFVLNNQQAWRGSVGVSKFSGIVSPAYIVLKLIKDIDSDFANYYFRYGAMVSQYLICSRGVGTIQRNLYWPQLKRVQVVFPPLEEQRCIANFLDQKTTEIDAAIAKKQHLIELLKEQKAILINQAVTKGLDPDVPMRDSGVDWIGEVPEHWTVKRLRLIGTTQNGISAGADYFGSGFPFISYSDVYNNREIPKKVNGLARASKQDRIQYSIEKGDVLFTRTSETIDEIGFSSTCMNIIVDSTFAGFLIRFRPKNEYLNPGYSKYYFSAQIHRSYFVGKMNLVIRASLSQELLKNLPVLIPPKYEQEMIFEYLESVSAEIDKGIDLQQKQIEKLKEYRVTLVSSVVTGKIKI